MRVRGGRRRGQRPTWTPLHSGTRRRGHRFVRHQEYAVLQRQTPGPAFAHRGGPLAPADGDHLPNWRGVSPLKGAIQEGSKAVVTLHAARSSFL